MKRYLVFKHDWYYPEGGWGDFYCDTDDLAEAIKESKSLNKYQEGHVVDTVTMLIMAAWSCDENGELRDVL